MFHYPPNPLSENGFRPTAKGARGSRPRNQANKTNDSDLSDQSGATSDEDEEDSTNHLGAGTGNASIRRASNFGVDSVAGSPALSDRPRSGSLGPVRPHRKRGGNSDVEDGPGNERQEGDEFRQPGEPILGLQTDVWEKLLSPPRAWHKRRFEVGINDLAFVGWPVFVREDGTWRKQRRKKTKQKPRPIWEGGELGHNEDAEDVRDEEGVEGNEGSGLNQSIASEGRPPGSRDSDDKDAMTMFNVVFVLDPPLLEYSTRIRDIYDNIIKKFTKALKWEQARTDYVWRESQHILHAKEMARERSMFWFP